MAHELNLERWRGLCKADEELIQTEESQAHGTRRWGVACREKPSSDSQVCWGPRRGLQTRTAVWWLEIPHWGSQAFIPQRMSGLWRRILRGWMYTRTHASGSWSSPAGGKDDPEQKAESKEWVGRWLQLLVKYQCYPCSIFQTACFTNFWLIYIGAQSKDFNRTKLSHSLLSLITTYRVFFLWGNQCYWNKKYI